MTLTKSKKFLALLLVAVLALGVVGGSLAYFTDKEQDSKTYQVGSVDIKLLYRTRETDPESDNFVMPNEADSTSYMYCRPTVQNNGKSDVYTRLMVYIPQALDTNDGHFAWDMNTAASGQWEWAKNTDGSYAVKTLDNDEGVACNVYTIYSKVALPGNHTPGYYYSTSPLQGFYLKTATTQKDIAGYIDAGAMAGSYHQEAEGYNEKDESGLPLEGGGDYIIESASFNIQIIAQAVQATGFANAHTAFAAYENNNWTIAQCVANPAN